ncbi:MAG: hypothetical protein HYR91_10495 [Flavobacteriia bacterium]|nr:hypothetical protein [Flavobacteriia bacterium]
MKLIFSAASEIFPYLYKMEERLDKILVQRNLVHSRIRAEQVIQEIGVKVNGKLIHKPGKKFPIACKIELVSEEIPWVSMDALKLEEAYNKWKFEIENGIFLDVGCSTGGFTEFLLSEKASKVFATDTSKNALHPKIKENELVIDLTGGPIREITKKTATDELDGCVINAPFLAMEKVFPFIHGFLKENGFVIALLKPTFEAEKDFLKHDGTLKNNKAFPLIIDNIKKIGNLNNLDYVDSIQSPILGNNGQPELIAFFRKKITV